MICSDIIGSKLEEAGELLPLRDGAISSGGDLGEGRNSCTELLGCSEPPGILRALVEVAGVEAVSIKVQEPCMPVDNVAQDQLVGWIGLVWVPSREEFQRLRIWNIRGARGTVLQYLLNLGGSLLGRQGPDQRRITRSQLLSSHRRAQFDFRRGSDRR